MLTLLLALAVPAVSPAVRAERSRSTLARNGTSLSTNGLRAARQATALDAERAFAADAQKLGQWTAFRKWAADDATMFVPQPTNAQSWLKDRKDPPKAIEWWPTASYVSCDGGTAVNTGGWKRPDGKVGYFSTVWQRQEDGGWKWIVDSGDDLKVSRPHLIRPVVSSARCPAPGESGGYKVASRAGKIGQGRSYDGGSLYWLWKVSPAGDRYFSVAVWNGSMLREVLSDKIPAPR